MTESMLHLIIGLGGFAAELIVSMLFVSLFGGNPK